jgi:hypothetical protein
MVTIGRYLRLRVGRRLAYLTLPAAMPFCQYRRSSRKASTGAEGHIVATATPPRVCCGYRAADDGVVGELYAAVVAACPELAVARRSRRVEGLSGATPGAKD